MQSMTRDRFFVYSTDLGTKAEIRVCGFLRLLALIAWRYTKRLPSNETIQNGPLNITRVTKTNYGDCSNLRTIWHFGAELLMSISYHYNHQNNVNITRSVWINPYAIDTVNGMAATMLCSDHARIVIPVSIQAMAGIITVANQNMPCTADLSSSMASANIWHRRSSSSLV